ncbi:MAG TPA: acyl-CoA carboxylase subunit epsilon [Microbacterium sp.]|nr:acyl-CoA carboxylase subunit epsilon [Microbacterium sp.]
MTRTHATDAAATGDAGVPLAIDVRRGEPTPEELAALIAVVSEAYATEADTLVSDQPARSAWSLSQRALRTPLPREQGWSRSAW